MLSLIRENYFSRHVLGTEKKTTSRKKNPNKKTPKKPQPKQKKKSYWKIQ